MVSITTTSFSKHLLARSVQRITSNIQDGAAPEGDEIAKDNDALTHSNEHHHRSCFNLLSPSIAKSMEQRKEYFTNYESRITKHESRIVNHKLQSTNYEL